MSNRRRIKGNGRVTPRKVMPKGGEEGVEVDSLADGVVFTLYMGRATLSVRWNIGDAKRISSLIMDAAETSERGAPDTPEVVRESGLLVPGTKDVLDVTRTIES